ncbi:hypothetical protein HK102_000143 [Quaeritorhiza haematococci]|nr:hypothetical protein HK102_000143 [Quaeritorhiza haematococci]
MPTAVPSLTRFAAAFTALEAGLYLVLRDISLDPDFLLPFSRRGEQQQLRTSSPSKIRRQPSKLRRFLRSTAAIGVIIGFLYLPFKYPSPYFLVQPLNGTVAFLFAARTWQWVFLDKDSWKGIVQRENVDRKKDDGDGDNDKDSSPTGKPRPLSLWGYVSMLAAVRVTARDQKKHLSWVDWTIWTFQFTIKQGVIIFLLITLQTPPDEILYNGQHPQTRFGIFWLWMHRTIRKPVPNMSMGTRSLAETSQFAAAHIIFDYLLAVCMFLSIDNIYTPNRMVKYLWTKGNRLEAPLFNHPYLTTSPRDFWNNGWHDIFKDLFVRCAFLPVWRLVKDKNDGTSKTEDGKKDFRKDSVLGGNGLSGSSNSVTAEEVQMDNQTPTKPKGFAPLVVVGTRPHTAGRPTPAQYLIPTLSAFIFSGIMHEFIITSISREMTGENLLFFTLQGIAVCAQTAIQNMNPFLSRMPRPVAMVLNHAFLFATMPLFFNPYRRACPTIFPINYGAWI